MSRCRCDAGGCGRGAGRLQGRCPPDGRGRCLCAAAGMQAAPARACAAQPARSHPRQIPSGKHAVPLLLVPHQLPSFSASHAVSHHMLQTVLGARDFQGLGSKVGRPAFGPGEPDSSYTTKPVLAMTTTRTETQEYVIYAAQSHCLCHCTLKDAGRTTSP